MLDLFGNHVGFPMRRLIFYTFYRKEIREHIKRKDSVMICEGLEDIERFNWVSLMREFSALPFTSGILMAMLTKSDKPIKEGKFPTE